MRATIPILMMLVLSSVLAGCLGGSDPEPTTDTDALVAVQDRHLLPFNTTDIFSHTLAEGVFEILEPLSVFVDVALPTTEGGAAASGDARIHLGLFLPDIEGCDWAAAELPEECKVPVIADIGPYWEDGDGPADERGSRRLGEFLIQNFVPQGYAVAQVSVFGTGQANHCMDLMGLSEQLGVDAAVTYLGTEPWSNGAVGLIGRSYDGSTPWQAAMFGNEHLKTIVPISGLIGMHELMWRNGTAETRGPIMHNVVYGQFGIDSVQVSPWAVLGFDPVNAVTMKDPDAEDAHTLCGDYLTGLGQGAGAYATGDHFAPEINDYWAERAFLDRVLQNYKGSVYLIQGMQDWNVDPHMAFPTHHLIEDAGLDIKGLYGQWAHMYPDRPLEHHTLRSGVGEEASRFSPRFDWAQDLLEWFDHYLKGTGPQPSLHAEVQDNTGAWRIEETYPPRDASWTVLDLATAMRTSGAELNGDGLVTPVESVYVPGIQQDVTVGEPVVYAFDALDTANDTRIAGNVLFHPTVIPTTANGQLFAQLRDAETGLRFGHAVMDLRFAAGGTESKPIVPGQPIVAKMEFEALDVVLPAGHGLELVLTQTGMDYLPAAGAGPVQIRETAASVLKLPIVERDDAAFFTPVDWDPCTFPPFQERVDQRETEQQTAAAKRFAERINTLYGCTYTV